MTALIFENFASPAYAVRTYPLYGCWHIERRADQDTTLMMTGTEGLEAYRALKAAWRKSRAHFDALCSTFAVEPD
jgi:hypothetical protein